MDILIHVSQNVGHVHEILVFITSASSEDSGESAILRPCISSFMISANILTSGSADQRVSMLYANTGSMFIFAQ